MVRTTVLTIYTVMANEGRSEKPQNETGKACFLRDVKGWLAVCSMDAKIFHFFGGG